MGKLILEKHKADFCVIGGGTAGICAAISAARNGVKVILIHDRPVLGGNASSEMRMHISGADVHNKIKNMRETGLIEEMRLENLRRNPNKNFSIFDTILYEKVKFEKNILLFLNTSCLSAKTKGSKILKVTGWQLTTQKYIEVTAKIFCDCSGDGILAPLSGAKYRVGREAKKEFNESLAPDRANPYTMGMTCLFSAENTGKPVKFEPPKWANVYKSCEDLPYGRSGHEWIKMGYWWIEMGGKKDTISDTEEIRDELLKTVYGIWDHIKNHCEDRKKAVNWDLNWVQFLPAKRESRRYIGAHVLSQNDIAAEGRFDDIVAYGGWPMDDHNSGGIGKREYVKTATIFHKTPIPYGIPFGMLYSKNIKNLMFAGRDASATHMAFSSTRVMGTGGIMGEAAGVAASIAVKKKVSPAQVKEKYIKELQQSLINEDCYIPWLTQEYSGIMNGAQLTSSSGDASVLIDGVNRPVNEISHRLDLKNNGWVKCRLKKSCYVKELTLIFDSMMEKNLQMSRHQKDDQLAKLPVKLVKAFIVKADGKTIFTSDDNYQRYVKIGVGKKIRTIEVKLTGTWGSKKTGIYALWVK